MCRCAGEMSHGVGGGRDVLLPLAHTGEKCAIRGRGEYAAMEGAGRNCDAKGVIDGVTLRGGGPLIVFRPRAPFHLEPALQSSQSPRHFYQTVISHCGLLGPPPNSLLCICSE